MMKITGLSRLFKWENLHNWWLTKYFFALLYNKNIYIYIYIYILKVICTTEIDVVIFKKNKHLYIPLTAYGMFMRKVVLPD